MATEEVKTDVSAEEVKKNDAVEAPAQPKTPPPEADKEKEKEKVNGDEKEEAKEEEAEETPTKGKGKRKAKTTPKKEPTPKKEKKTTPKKETPKRKESGGAAHTMETRTRKKAREAVDLVVGGPQRAESLINFLGADYNSEKYTGPSEEQLKMMFRVFDRDNDGHIGSEELAEVLRSMGKRPLTKKIQKMLDECDVDKNGTIELEEFITYMQKKAAKKAEALRNKGKGTKKEDEPEEEEKGKAKGKGKAKAKKAPAKKGKKGAEAEPEPEAAAASSSATTTTTTTAEAGPSKLARGPSILDYYTSHAGLQDANAPVDKYNNPEGPQYDLGVEGAFTAYKILAGLFYDASLDNAATTMTPADFKGRVGGSLQSKGFSFEVVTTQKDFIAKLGDYDEAWIISNKVLDGSTTPEEFTDEVVKFHEGGGGLFLWADNHPWTAHANLILKKLFNIEVQGNKGADKILQVGDSTKAGHFAQHLITSGIKNLFEGRTVSFPTLPIPDSLKTLATSTDDTPVILYSDNTKLPPTSGRVVVDCGFTKLWVHWDSAGTERYVKNASVWLIGIDNRIASDAPLVGKLQKKAKVEKAVWQFKHGGWHNYDKEASNIVEEAFKDWQANPYTDVRSVKSGFWHYMVDFRQMKQTNVEHKSHTQRDIRRQVQEVYE